MTDTEYFDAFSKLNANQQPFLHTCTVVAGDGSTKVEFVQGRARVTREEAAFLANHPHIMIPGFSKGEVPAVPAAAQAIADAAFEPDVEVEEDADEADPGLEALTADGQPRCQARKGDGSQCANPAADGPACKVPQHRAKLGVA